MKKPIPDWITVFACCLFAGLCGFLIERGNIPGACIAAVISLKMLSETE